MKRRQFLQRAAVAVAAPGLVSFAAGPNGEMIDLKNAAIITPREMSPRANKAVVVLVEEAEKRCGIRWSVLTGSPPPGATAIHVDLQTTPKIAPEGYSIRSSAGAQSRSIAISGADDRGLLFGVGKFLRTVAFGRQQASVDARRLNVTSSPKYPLRGHQLGYRPKTNSYDAWTVPMWDQYIRDLAVFGTNAIELLPPRTDDLPDSPHFPLPPGRMMREMSRLADGYGLDVWVWYPAMDKDYSDPRTVDLAIKEWAATFQLLPRLDAIFVPGGDPGRTAPKYLLDLLEKQKSNLRRYHPKARIWVSPQGFNAQWLQEFLDLAARSDTQSWLDGIVYGPQCRLSLDETRKRLPEHYPIRFYPDITHSVECEFPVPDWDVAFALTEGREVINPRPEDQANILRRISPHSIGFITYSEGCNDDVNKFVWSSLGWDPEMNVIEALRDFSRYFIGERHSDGFAQGLLDLEKNWRGPLAINEGVSTTLARFQDMERIATPALLENWRFQQALYRAYYDAYLRSRLLDETARVRRALDLLGSLNDIGWTAEPLGIGNHPSSKPPNGLDPAVVLDEAERILTETTIAPAGRASRERVRELGEALFQSIRMQLAVQRYQGEAVERGANLATLDYPVTDCAWLRRRIIEMRKLPSANEQVRAARELLARTDPAPGGFYDELGDPSNRPHLVLGPGHVEDPEFRASALTGFDYPDEFGDAAPIAWKHWAESLFDAPLKMQYQDLDREAQYRLRVLYSGDAPGRKMRLTANGNFEIHPFLKRPWPPAPLEFDLPFLATSTGELHLAWTREPGLGGNGRGCQVAEVWVMKK